MNAPAAAIAVRRDSYQEQFEQQANSYAQLTELRPALINAAEAKAINARYPTGQLRLKELNELVRYRAERWDEMQGHQPFNQLTPERREAANRFFDANGVRRLGDPELAAGPGGKFVPPPNPIKSREEQTKLLADTRAHQAADQEIVEAESKTNSSEPARTELVKIDTSTTAKEPDHLSPQAAVASPPATLEIEYVSFQGFACKLTIRAPSGVAVLEQGVAAMKKLVDQKAQAPAAGPAVVVATQAAGESSDVPLCVIHHTPMEKRQGKNGSFWSCPKKLDDGSWCPYKPK